MPTTPDRFFLRKAGLKPSGSTDELLKLTNFDELTMTLGFILLDVGGKRA